MIVNKYISKINANYIILINDYYFQSEIIIYIKINI